MSWGRSASSIGGAGRLGGAGRGGSAAPRPAARGAILLACGLLVLAGLLAGCQGGFNQQSFETIYLGEPADAVQRKLGPPTDRQPDRWVYVRHRPYYYRATIRFAEGRVSGKSHSFEPNSPD